MGLIGSHILHPTTDPAERAKREQCAAAGHEPITYNPIHEATWCRCGAEVIAGNHGKTPENRMPAGGWGSLGAPRVPRWTHNGKPTHVWLVEDSNAVMSLRDPYDRVLVRARRVQVRGVRSWRVWWEEDGERLIADGLATMDEAQQVGNAALKCRNGLDNTP